jgi:UDP-N-acetylglucosamine 1-carboxyvinyltransferase
MIFGSFMNKKDIKNTVYRVSGGYPLSGSIRISGSKNAAVGILPAAVLSGGVSTVYNVPCISDIAVLIRILEGAGAKVSFSPGAGGSFGADGNSRMAIDVSGISTTSLLVPEMAKLRASYYLWGAMLGRYGEVEALMPGGCNFGAERPIDYHIRAFEQMGAEVSVDTENGIIRAKARGGRLTGARIIFDASSVGATINVILAAVLADGLTVIENAAREPHIVDLSLYLNSLGARVRGAGTNIIKIEGVEKLHSGSHTIVPDQIEAGTFMAAVCACGGELEIQSVIPRHLDAISQKLRAIGAQIEETDDKVICVRSSKLSSVDVRTMPYPGFPTDMQPQLAACLLMAQGTSRVFDSVWTERFSYAHEFRKLGADIEFCSKPSHIKIRGVAELYGASEPLNVPDLRAGAALTIAALSAKGDSVLTNVEFIERGYENFTEKLSSVGASIERAYSETVAVQDSRNRYID